MGKRSKNTNQDLAAVGRGPVLIVLVLEVDETSNDEAVDLYSRVGVEIDGKVLGRASGRLHKNDDGRDSVEEEGSNEDVKGFDGSPETTEREKSLLTKLLVKTGMYKIDRKHVSQTTEGDEDGEIFDVHQHRH
jgi:hypothetical protein